MRRTRYRYLILLLLLIPVLAEGAGEFKAGFTLKAQSIRDGDLVSTASLHFSSPCMEACLLHQNGIGMNA